MLCQHSFLIGPSENQTKVHCASFRGEIALSIMVLHQIYQLSFSLALARLLRQLIPHPRTSLFPAHFAKLPLLATHFAFSRFRHDPSPGWLPTPPKRRVKDTSLSGPRAVCYAFGQGRSLFASTSYTSDKHCTSSFSTAHQNKLSLAVSPFGVTTFISAPSTASLLFCNTSR